ncbi:MAG TPA: hypothetical protein VGF45_16685 [Polyangia bacterium]
MIVSRSRYLRLAPWDLSPLRQASWWVALLVLIVNDNWGKGSDLLPGWLTGKLSDFAFLVVAPVLLFVLLPTRLPQRRRLALGVVAAVYTVAEISVVASDALVAGLRILGINWRLWPDVTDLIALAVLPVTWHLLRPAAEISPAVLPAKPAWRERLAVALGAWACIATSALEYTQRAFLVNRTRAAVTVSVSWNKSSFPCDGDLAALAGSLPTDSFLAPVPLSLEPGSVAALDQPPPEGQSPVGRCSNTADGTPAPEANPLTANTICTVARVSLPGEAPFIMRAARAWIAEDPGMFACSGDPHESRCAPRLDPFVDPGEGALSLVQENGQIRLSADKGIELIPMPAPM